MSGELENVGQHGPGGEEMEWTDWQMIDDRRLFGTTGDWRTTRSLNALLRITFVVELAAVIPNQVLRSGHELERF